MPRATLQLPALLEAVCGTAAVDVEARTLSEALQLVGERHPDLAVHLFDESGDFRQHVLCFHNGENTRWFDDLNRPLAEGDEIRILQAVSGG